MDYQEAVKELDLKDPVTKEPITPDGLIEVLKEDIVLAVERPGSWEGAYMLDVLRGHGFFNE